GTEFGAAQFQNHFQLCDGHADVGPLLSHRLANQPGSFNGLTDLAANDCLASTHIFYARVNAFDFAARVALGDRPERWQLAFENLNRYWLDRIRRDRIPLFRREDFTGQLEVVVEHSSAMQRAIDEETPDPSALVLQTIQLLTLQARLLIELCY